MESTDWPSGIFFAEVEPLYKQALATREKALGPDHPDVAIILENQADLLRDTRPSAATDRPEALAAGIRAKHAEAGLTD